MARLAAQEKGEYYPTPLSIATHIANLLHVKPQRNKPVVRLFDPCAGKGEALARIAQILRGHHPDIQVQTWGVEINPQRAAEAAERLDLVIPAPFEVVGWKPFRWGVASLLFLNPPYDFSQASGYRRMEHYFLDKATPSLEPGGLLVYIVPVSAIDWQMVHFLWQWYEDIQAYRFPDEDGLFDQFKQVVILARRLRIRDRRRYPPHEHILVRLSHTWYAEAADVAREEMPPLTELTSPLVIPTTRQKASLYRAAWSEDEMAAKVEASGQPGGPLALALLDLYGPEEALDLEPLVPPKRGHIAQILASGLMGTMAFPGEVLKGRAVKTREVVEETVEVDRQGEEVNKTVYRDVYTTHLVRVTPQGLDHLSTPQAVKDFLQAHADRLAAILKSRLKPYGNGVTPQEEAVLDRLSPDRLLPGMEKPGLLPNQRETAIAATRAIRRYGVAHIVAEMGYGKTTTALAVAELTNAYPTLVICPPHLVDKWAREAVEVVPGARPVIVESIGELEAVRQEYRPGDRLIVIISRSRIKLGPGWTAASPTIYTLPNEEEHPEARKRFAKAVRAYREARKAYLAAKRNPTVSEEALEALRRRMREAREAALEKAHIVHVCPDCGQPVVDGRAVKSSEALARRPHKCPNTVLEWDPEEEDYVEKPCGAPLYQSYPVVARRWPLADYIRKKMRGFFRLLVADEVHQYKAKESDQGWAFGLLANAIPWTLTLTGTFFGGPSTSIFWLLHRTQANVRRAFPFHGERRWVEAYGVEEVTVKERRSDGGVAYYRGRKRASVTVREKPGIAPAIVRHILPTTIFRSLSDLGLALPPFQDEVVYIEMSEEQEADYESLYALTWNWLLEFWPRYTASWLQWTLARPNSCFREEVVEAPDGQAVTFPPVVDLEAGELLPKEEWLVHTVSAELAQGRRCLVYLRQTGTRDIRSRLVHILGQAGIRAKVLDQSVPPRKREAWLKKNNPPVLITNPKLVETGLDLVQYSTAIFYEPDYSLYTLWQACRRVWRLGQTKPVKVYYPVYVSSLPGKPAMEDLALRLIGQKMAAAQLLYGDDVSGAIVPDMDDNLVVQLVNAIKSGEAENLARATNLFGADDRTTASPVGSPTRVSLLLLSWEEWLRRNGVTWEDVRPRRRRRNAPPPGQLALALGV